MISFQDCKLCFLQSFKNEKFKYEDIFGSPLETHKFFPVNHILTPLLCAKLKYDDENFFVIAQGNMRKHCIKTCESKKRGMFNFLCLTSVKMYLHFIGVWSNVSKNLIHTKFDNTQMKKRTIIVKIMDPKILKCLRCDVSLNDIVYEQICAYNNELSLMKMIT